jgi:AcrR family transcriptional regulator
MSILTYRRSVTSRPYHHGDLRRALLQHAERVVLDSGPAQLSLREVARRAGVSHAAPAHHFHDKAGLLAALAADGFRLLGERLTEAFESTRDFLEVGVAYVQFALDHRAHFEVMFRADLYDIDRPEVAQARTAATQALAHGIGALPASAVGPDPKLAGRAAWSLVHGFATLYLGGALVTDHPVEEARAVARLLFAEVTPT